MTGDPTGTYESIAAAITDRLTRNQRIRRSLPGGGRVRIDRQLPFLCVYRSPPGAEDPGTRELVTSEAAYLFATGDPEHHDGLNHLCATIFNTMKEHFGTFLMVHLWAEEDRGSLSVTEGLRPAFHLLSPNVDSLTAAMKPLEDRLHEISLRSLLADVQTSHRRELAPPGLPPLGPTPDEPQCVHVGIGVRPIYRDHRNARLFPLVLQSLRRQLAVALRKSIATFIGSSAEQALYYQTLGPTSLVKSVRLVDQQLCEVSESFDFLLKVTPVNANDAWQVFADSQYEQAPTLYYRSLPYHPSHLKRRLFEIPIERLEDATIAHLCWEKQDNLDRQLTAVKAIDTPDFLYDSLHLYPAPDRELLGLANEILRRLTYKESTPQEFAEPEEIAAAAREQIDDYHLRLSDFNASVEICDHIASGMMVSKDILYISESATIRRDRVLPLLHHEIGTHLLTYFNGRRQPFRQLYAGFAGYEELQEGLAILAEFLAGGLTRNRLRTLAGRVLAVNAVVQGASFVETFRLLHYEHGFPPRVAFVTTLRAHRAGGLTKDVVYLRGFTKLLEYLRSDHDVEPLYVGKIALKHVPIVQELRRRGVIQPPALLPRFWDAPQFKDRLAACRERTVLELLESIS